MVMEIFSRADFEVTDPYHPDHPLHHLVLVEIEEYEEGLEALDRYLNGVEEHE